MNFLITAGPTREYLDPVRFISNPSTGRMGVSIARAAKKKRHKVTLIAGPLSVPVPDSISLLKVVSARDMLQTVKQHLKWADVLVMTAAVGDWRPRAQKKHKIKKTTNEIIIKLIRNPDLLAEAAKLKKQGKTKKKLILVGFSVDTEEAVKNAKRKIKKKNLDLIVANRINSTKSGFAALTNQVVIIDRYSKVVRLPLLTKQVLADKLVKRIEEML